ncbi:unnamed protein product [Lactuca saligna]|uniref:Ribosomal protein L9 domain-containing protein n=1 Tax=Lactuca saligna TaxID=75948 RepID=A0AA35YNP8_LACSI|nr:unnamed protein product [Lactuca saligna]
MLLPFSGEGDTLLRLEDIINNEEQVYTEPGSPKEVVAAHTTLVASLLIAFLHALLKTIFICQELSQTMDKMGKANEAVKVAPGHFLNHLIP